MHHIRRTALTALAAAASAALVACGTPTAPTTPGATASGTNTNKTVTVVTHDSFTLSDQVKATFQAQTGYELKTVSQGDGGQLVNQLILTKDSPLGDAVFGIDERRRGEAAGGAGMVLRAEGGGDMSTDLGALASDATAGEVRDVHRFDESRLKAYLKDHIDVADDFAKRFPRKK